MDNPSDPRNLRRYAVGRRTLLGTGTGLVALAGCGNDSTTSSTTSSTAGASTSSSAAASPAASGNTVLKAGSYTATFESSAGAPGGTGSTGAAAGGTPPSGAAPSGSASAGSAASGAAPGGTPPSGAPGGTPPSGAAGSAGGAAPGAAPSGAASGGAAPSGAASAGAAPGGTTGGSASGGKQVLKGAYLVNGTTATITGGTWKSSTADQNVFLVVNGGHLTLKDATIVKTGDSSNGDGCNFYGLNSAVLVVGEGSTVTLQNCHVTTASQGSNALFSTNGAKLTATGVTIRTSKDSSRGLDATYTGTVTASDVDIATTGQHCACLATDRGNGTVVVTGTSKLASSGQGSPLVYSTGDIRVTGATGTSTGAQTMVIEGKNQITLDNCLFTTRGTEGMMIYQSFSGDAADANATASHSTMTIKDSTITSTTAKPMVYVTNTTCVVTVTSSKLVHQASAKLLDLEADQWGTTGSNGGHATITLADCGKLTGNLTAGSTSAATVKTSGNTTLAGTTSGSVTVSKG